ncbi:hypothetical protein LSH36_26g09044 [Paralvinella palmiformis]|uniref:Uncharacterized protein n=1 Tax=Paralvinella palmiformis TaxID=53620 RepID=A0AAD9K9I5_9ANNE|nr:hypothetical protein LSH36_26g09044 [Paralvinella palmiformis]
MPRSVTEEFTFTFGTRSQRSTLKVNITIPLNESVKEFSYRLINAHQLPCFVEGALKDELEQFIAIETKKLQDANAEEAIERVRKKQVSVESLAKQWTNLFSKEILKYSDPEPISNEVVFSEVYHTLIHSPALETLLNLEHTYALSVCDVIDQRNRDLALLEKRQTEDMEEAIRKLGISSTDEQINQMAQRHFENTQLVESKWASELSNLNETQRREYRDWVMDLHEDTQTTDSTPAYAAPMVPQPQRLQTAMSLYSNSLCGLVLHVDNRLNSYTGIKRDFAKVCEQSTDFHFPSLEQQFEVIEEAVLEANEWHQPKRVADDGDQISVKSTGSDRVSLKSTTSSSSDEMTISWCMKRAELVFKCIKGFMMEFATWSGQQSHTVQFLVPKGLSDDTFTSISNMLSSIFRMSNPVVAKSGNNKMA